MKSEDTKHKTSKITRGSILSTSTLQTRECREWTQGSEEVSLSLGVLLTLDKAHGTHCKPHMHPIIESSQPQ